MEFKNFNKELQKHVEDMTKDVTKLFRVNVDGDTLWNLYLDSFPKGTNEIFIERRQHDCSCCRHFIKNMGNVVRIKDGEVTTIWDFDAKSDVYQPVIDALKAYVENHTIESIFVTDKAKLGTEKTPAQIAINGKTTVQTFYHFYVELPSKLVSNKSRTYGDLMGEYNTLRSVFQRSLEELTPESIEIVLDLISQNSLERGAEWKSNLETFQKYQTAYLKLSQRQRNLYAWEHTETVGAVVGRIRNTSIGTLLIDLSEDVPLDEAVRKYDSVVCGANYKRVKPVFSKRQLDDAKKALETAGYMESLKRRYAVLDDVTVNNVLFVNRNVVTVEGDIFAEMEKGIPLNPKKFGKIEEIEIDKFIGEVLPRANSVELLLENRLSQNMVSLIAPVDKSANSMFKWDNAFSWAYSGNVALSNIKENVKNAGGKVDGVLRFSIQWNDTEYNGNDFDAHCKEQTNRCGSRGSYEIYYGNKRTWSANGGMLDVDIISPNKNVAAVENIVYAKKEDMGDGTYRFFVDTFSDNGGRDGFKAEIEFDGIIRSYEYPKRTRDGERIDIATVTLKDGVFSIKEDLPSGISSRDIWGLSSNQFVPVSMAMYSPNYWDDQQGVGHRHYFFILKGAVNPENPNGFYNEFLKEELRIHRHVMEALGGKMAVADADNQLSGVGFSSTRRDEMIVKVKGATERILKVKF